MKRVNNYSKTAMYLFLIIGLIGANGIALAVTFIPTSPLGNLVYVTFVPFFIGFAGFMLALITFTLTSE